jgi:hypothetical protein
MMIDALQGLLQGIFGAVFPLVWVLLKIVLIIAPLLLCVAYLTFWERKVIGWMQVRIGPNRVGPWGLIQPIADGLKLLLKEVVIPTGADKSVFLLAPMFAFAPALAAWAVVPFNDTLVLANVNASLLYIMSITSIGVYGIILSGWASNSKYAFLGGMRSAAQMISYEAWRDMRWASSGWSLRRKEPTINALCSVRQRRDAGAEPMYAQPVIANSAWRRRWSMFSLPSPRTSCASEVQLLDVEWGLTNAPIAEAPCSEQDELEPIGNVFQRRLPVNLLPDATLFEHGTVKALLAVEGLVRKAVAVGDPAFVDGFVFQRNHTHDLALFLTCTIRLAPSSCGLTDLRRDSSQVRAL